MRAELPTGIWHPCVQAQTACLRPSSCHILCFWVTTPQSVTCCKSLEGRAGLSAGMGCFDRSVEPLGSRSTCPIRPQEAWPTAPIISSIALQLLGVVCCVWPTSRLVRESLGPPCHDLLTSSLVDQLPTKTRITPMPWNGLGYCHRVLSMWQAQLKWL